ncbi:DUF4395 domain-containing protein [Raineyella sp. LH-20]|uniref:DUF4395 domain-containing protein n=1 Tax=Raineyella sp. LH-20 TaxID=3081204 RepID=UPI0029532F3E|nr:DUF4395 domain-containing protein [Raineyella sp. LH-20]WOP18953.1 DUF4395 domain-containing protein [Raineyella sp. LH-20]
MARRAHPAHTARTSTAPAAGTGRPSDPAGTSGAETPTPVRIDPRGPRFGAIITSVLLAVTLLLGPTWGLVPLGIQTLAFIGGSVFGLSRQPWGWIYRAWVRPRLGPPAELEDEAPPRFAQTVGLVFAVLALVGALTGLAPLFWAATGVAFIAAFLNAAFDFCLGCETYLLVQRLRARTPHPSV